MRMMQETNGTMTSPWKRPLKGWRWLAAWVLLIGSLAALARVVLGLTGEKALRASTPLPWLLSFGLALAVVILLGLLLRCFSSWRHFKRLLLTLACLAGLIALFYAEEDLRGRIAWGKFKTKWEAKGEKLDFAAFIPPQVPDEQNFAMTPVVASSYSHILDRNGHQVSPQNTDIVNRLEMPLEPNNGGPTNGIGNWQKAVTSNLEPWQRYYRDLSQTTNLFPVAPQPQTPAADVLLALSQYDSTIEELRRAAALPASRFPLNYDSEQTFAILLPHLAPLKGCTRVLQLRAIAELEAGQSENALADIGLALRLTDKVRSEPFLISQLVRIAMLQITLQPVWEGLAHHRWSDPQLVQLDPQLAGFDFVTDYQAAMRGENAAQVATTQFLRHHPDQLCNLADFGEADPVRFPNFVGQWIPSGWFYQNQLHSSQFMLEHFLPLADPRQQTISPARLRQTEESLRTMPLAPFTVLCKMFFPALTNSPRRFALAQTSVNLARTALALERYRLARGSYPATLDALAPQFIPSVPRDPIGGQPLHYRLADNGQFLLYSVGWNEKDDGGTLALTQGGSVDLENGDWVWRYPALPAQ